MIKIFKFGRQSVNVVDHRGNYVGIETSQYCHSVEIGKMVETQSYEI